MSAKRLTKKQEIDLQARRQVLVSGCVQIVLPNDALKVECPACGPTAIKSYGFEGINFECGCSWKHGRGNLDGWFRDIDRLAKGTKG